MQSASRNDTQVKGGTRSPETPGRCNLTWSRNSLFDEIHFSGYVSLIPSGELRLLDGGLRWL